MCVKTSPDPGRKWSWSRFRFVDTAAVANKLQDDLVAIFEGDSDVEVVGVAEEYPLD